MSASITRCQRHAEELVNVVQNQCYAVQTKLYTAWQDKNARPKLTLYAGLVLVTSIWLAVTILLRLRIQKRQLTIPPSTPNPEKRSPFKQADRKPGGNLKHSLFPSISIWLVISVTLLTIVQYGLPRTSAAQEPNLTRPGPSQTPNPSLTALSATAPSTISPWACAPCNGMTGLSLTTSILSTTL